MMRSMAGCRSFLINFGPLMYSMGMRSRLWYHSSIFYVDRKVVHSVKLLTAQHGAHEVIALT